MNAIATNPRLAVARRIVAEWNRYRLADLSTPVRRNVARHRFDGALEVGYLALGYRTPFDLETAMMRHEVEAGDRPAIVYTSPSTSTAAREWDEALAYRLEAHS